MPNNAMPSRVHCGVAAGTGRVLLLVDDEPHVLQALCRTLRSKSYEILCAHSGAEALEVAKRHTVQVVMTDHRMPGMTGLELLTQLQASQLTAVRLMLSGQADEEQIGLGLASGLVHRFLAKPWDNDALRLQVRDAFLLHDDLVTAISARHCVAEQRTADTTAAGATPCSES